MKYRVVNKTRKHNDFVAENYLDKAKKLKEDFGLTHLTLSQVYHVWSTHSNTYASDWLTPTKKDVEAAFQVSLEPVE